MADETSDSGRNVTQAQRADQTGLVGYACLGLLCLGGFLGGCALFFFGIGEYVQAPGDLNTTEDAHRLLGTLEGAVILCGVGALSFLVSAVSGVVLLKELGDDAARRARGPVR